MLLLRRLVYGYEAGAQTLGCSFVSFLQAKWNLDLLLLWVEAVGSQRLEPS